MTDTLRMIDDVTGETVEVVWIDPPARRRGELCQAIVIGEGGEYTVPYPDGLVAPTMENYNRIIDLNRRAGLYPNPTL